MTTNFIQEKINKKETGFTLIELLIVVAIIGILSTLLMTNFIGIRQRARDGKRKSDISQMQAALEQYRADQGAYPSSLPNCGSNFTSPDASSTYMAKLPCDPEGVSYYNTGNYYYTTTTNGYTLSACLENTGDSQGVGTSPGGTGCTSNFYYTAQNP